MPAAETVMRYVDLVEANLHADAAEQFHQPDARLYENTEPPRAGGAAQVARERAIIERARSMTSCCIRPVLIDGDTVAIRWQFVFAWRDGTETRMEEVAWQRWQGERIQEERFFYDPAQMKPRPV